MASTLEVVPWARFFMRPLQSFLKVHWNQSAEKQSKRIYIPPHLCQALSWWLARKNIFKGNPIVPPKPDLTLTTDSSRMGWGAHLGQFVTQGTWSEQDKLQHINFLELKAILLALQTFEDKVSAKVVKCFCDNTTACSYIANLGGTHSPTLLSLLQELISWCIQRNITLQATYLPGVQNDLADLLSRTVADHREWSIPQSIADQLFLLWERPSIDLFASKQNARLPIYCCLYQGDF